MNLNLELGLHFDFNLDRILNQIDKYRVDQPKHTAQD